MSHDEMTTMEVPTWSPPPGIETRRHVLLWRALVRRVRAALNLRALDEAPCRRPGPWDEEKTQA